MSPKKKSTTNFTKAEIDKLITKKTEDLTQDEITGMLEHARNDRRGELEYAIAKYTKDNKLTDEQKEIVIDGNPSPFLKIPFISQQELTFEQLGRIRRAHKEPLVHDLVDKKLKAKFTFKDMKDLKPKAPKASGSEEKSA